MNAEDPNDPRLLPAHNNPRRPAQLPVTLRASVVTTNEPDRPSRYVRLTITDNASRALLGEVEMTYAAFGELVSGGGDVPGLAEVGPLEVIGKRRETRTVRLTFAVGEAWRDNHNNALPPFLEAVAEHERDGWQASRFPSGKAERDGLGRQVYAATLTRYVDAAPGTTEEPAQ